MIKKTEAHTSVFFFYNLAKNLVTFSIARSITSMDVA